MVSSLYKNKIGVVTHANETLSAWMDKKGFADIEAFRGKLGQSGVDDPAFYERAQFLKHYGHL
jgi:dihydroorotate dehydrogenase (fumarate)